MVLGQADPQYNVMCKVTPQNSPSYSLRTANSPLPGPLYLLDSNPARGQMLSPPQATSEALCQEVGRGCNDGFRGNVAKKPLPERNESPAPGQTDTLPEHTLDRNLAGQTDSVGKLRCQG